MPRTRMQFHRSTLNIIAGAFVWLITLTRLIAKPTAFTLIEQLFLLAPLVIVPLALPLVGTPIQPGPDRFLYRLIRISQPLGALAAVISFFLPVGLAAAGLAAGWLLVTGLIAVWGLTRLLRRGLRLQMAELCVDAGLLMLPVGGGWFVLARLGVNPLGFGDVIVLLTAVHFHYAGFAAPIITGLVGRVLSRHAPDRRRFYRMTAAGVIAGTPVVAAGITFSPLLELIGALIVAAGLTGVAYLTVFVIVPTLTHRLARTLLVISAASIVVGMLLTLAYATGEFSGYAIINIPQMARIHGLANALGFALCGLAGWQMVEVTSGHRPPCVVSASQVLNRTE
jgi:hypothetical protein